VDCPTDKGYSKGENVYEIDNCYYDFAYDVDYACVGK